MIHLILKERHQSVLHQKNYIHDSRRNTARSQEHRQEPGTPPGARNTARSQEHRQEPGTPPGARNTARSQEHRQEHLLLYKHGDYIN
jgi:hypothetical protein